MLGSASKDAEDLEGDSTERPKLHKIELWDSWGMTTLWRCRDHQWLPRQPGQQEVATISTWKESGTNGTKEWCTQELWTQHPRIEGTGKVTPNPSLFLPCCLLLVTLIEVNWQGHLKDIGLWGWSQKEWISDWMIKKNIQTMKTEFFFFMTKVGPGETF